MISIKDFMELEFRTARVNAAERVEGTDKLMQLRVQVGDEERTIVAGIAQVWITCDLRTRSRIRREVLVFDVNVLPRILNGS